MPDLRLIQIRRTSHVPNLMHKLCYRGGSRGKVPGVRTPPPRDDLRFSKTTDILQKYIYVYMWFIGEEQERSAPPPKNNSGLAPVLTYFSIKPRF